MGRMDTGQIQKIYGLLGDEVSKDIFEKPAAV